MASQIPSSPMVVGGKPMRSVSSGSIPSPLGRSPKPTMRSMSSGSVVVPNLPNNNNNNNSTSLLLPQSMARSMTIDEMRQLHQRALNDAEAKRTELRLVLASRYRELVGSSDEVLKMRERSQELHQLVHALPSLMTKLGQVQQQQQQQSSSTEETNKTTTSDSNSSSSTTTASTTTTTRDEVVLRRDLSRLPRLVHRALDKKDVYKAATSLIQLFDLIASQTDKYPLANSLAHNNNNNKTTTTTTTTTLSNNNNNNNNNILNPLIKTQIKMTFLHVQGIPARIIRMTEHVLMKCAESAEQSAAALACLHLLRKSPLQQQKQQQHSVKLLDLYFDSKAKLLQSLLHQLGDADTTTTTTTNTTNNGVESSTTTTTTTTAAEVILTKIVGILQRDIILYPYLMFVRRDFGSNTTTTTTTMLNDLPQCDADMVRTKASNCLAAHLPLIRTKVKTVLVSIAGTTASALGHIRQTLYDKTDGVECLKQLDGDIPGTWEDAVQAMVDVRIVLAAQHGGGGGGHGTTTTTTNVVLERANSRGETTTTSSRTKFSFWSALFSNTFSSLVHSLLTTSFHSVHGKVVSTLRTSLANAPPFHVMLPQEAYRNTLKIATELDLSLRKVSDDAHELLVHAEERFESERRLRQSLYVQTCEIMGRLVCELRRMLLYTPGSDGTKEFLVGRLCHLLLFRLTSLPTLLQPNHSPCAVTTTTRTTTSLGSKSTSTTTSSGGMITLFELQSAFDLADDNEDGLITFEEAMEAVDSAFSGTQFHGAEMIRETLLLKDVGNTGQKVESTTTTSTSTITVAAAPPNVTLHELALLSARGLRHDTSGPRSALGTIREALNNIIDSCFMEWSNVVLSSPTRLFQTCLTDFLTTIATTSEMEFQRIYYGNNNNQGKSSSSVGEFADYLLLDSATNEQQQQRHHHDDSFKPIIGNVSSHLLGYFLSLSSILNRSVCPCDSASTSSSVLFMQQEQDNAVVVPNMMSIIRHALLKQSLQILVESYDECIKIAMEEEEEEEQGDDEFSNKKKKKKKKPTIQDANTTTSGMVQLNMDIGFVQFLFFERNQYGFEWRNNNNKDDDDTTTTKKYKNQLERVFRLVDRLLRMSDRTNYSMIVKVTEERHAHVLEVSELFLSCLFGESTLSVGGDNDFGGMMMTTTTDVASTPPPPTLHPIASSRRFGLLPIQSDRSLAELQARRGKYGKDNKQSTDDENQGNRGEGMTGSSVMSSFFSSMLKKK